MSRRRVGSTSRALAVPLLAGCSSDPLSRNSKQSQAPTAVCQKVSGVEADGPDPDVDPVERLFDLISADRELVHSNAGGHAATKFRAKDDADLNKVCPGVA
jgi:hypothetical protein